MTDEMKTSVVAEATTPVVKAANDDYFADFDFSKLEVNIEDMFKSGVHFGHSKSRKHPKADEYIFATKNGISVIDLQKTVERLKTATDFITKLVASGQNILFVGTKKQAKRLTESSARRCGMPFVNERWLGGTFTNYPIIARRAKYLRDSQEKLKNGEFAHYTKFERMKIMEEMEKLESKMGGIKEMQKLPGAIFAVSVIEDNLAIQEAKKLKIPIVALVDSNVNSSGIDYPVPANEDAVSSLKLMLAYMAKAVLDGKSQQAKVTIEEKTK